MRFALTLILAFACIGCQNSSVKEGGEKTLRMQLSASPETFDPRDARSLNAQVIAKMLYDGLTRIDQRGKPVPSVAQQITLSSDGKVYTFVLRESFWSDGTPVTAHDFARAWRSILSPERPSECASSLYAIRGAEAAKAGKISVDQVGITALDDRMLVVELERPTPYFLELTAFPTYFPMPEQMGKRAKLISNGPFVLHHHKPDSELLLVRNDRYWDAGSVGLERIYLPVIPDDMTAVSLFEKGELDWVGSPLATLPTERIPHMTEVQAYAAAATLWYKCNTRKVPFNNAKVRKAFAYAVDRQALIDHVVPLGQSAATTPVPLSMGLRAAPAFTDGDGERAGELLDEGLAELGLTRETMPRVTLLSSNSERYQKLAQAMQEQWREQLGVRVEIETTEFKTLLSRMSHHDYQLAGKIWFADFSDPTSFLSLYRDLDDPVVGGFNETGWHDVEFTRLMARAEREVDPRQRQAILRRAEDIMVEEMPVIPIYHHTLCYLKDERLTSVSLPPSGCPDFKWARRQPIAKG